MKGRPARKYYVKKVQGTVSQWAVTTWSYESQRHVYMETFTGQHARAKACKLASTMNEDNKRFWAAWRVPYTHFLTANYTNDHV